MSRITLLSFFAIVALTLIFADTRIRTVHAAMRDAAPPDLEAAIQAYVENQGSVFRGECASVPTGVSGGTCYEASVLNDGVAEVWLALPFTDGGSLVLFDQPFEGWELLSLPVSFSASSAGIWTAADWSSVTGNWWFTEGVLPDYPGIVSLYVEPDGTSGIGAGRFGVAKVSFTSFEQGIAYGTITTLEPQGATVGSGRVALILLDDGTAILTSSASRRNLTFQRQIP
ncbi:MAG TPA: hypothetical protein VKV26_22460 [Dehalococcoidia bacterium]|nr:hypothetical protein [Dehalococcoidia bacterium]